MHSSRGLLLRLWSLGTLFALSLAIEQRASAALARSAQRQSQWDDISFLESTEHIAKRLPRVREPVPDWEKPANTELPPVPGDEGFCNEASYRPWTYSSSDIKKFTSGCPVAEADCATTDNTGLGLQLGCDLHPNFYIQCCLPQKFKSLSKSPVKPAWVCSLAPQLSNATMSTLVNQTMFIEDRSHLKPLVEMINVYIARLEQHGAHVHKGVALELGSKQGVNLEALREAGFQKVVGYDWRWPYVNISRKAAPQHEVVMTHEELATVKDVDFVLVMHTLDQMRRPWDTMALVAAAMKPGAVMVGEIADACPVGKSIKTASLAELADCVSAWRGDSSLALFNFFQLQYFTKDSLQFLLESTGFKVLEAVPYQDGSTYKIAYFAQKL